MKSILILLFVFLAASAFPGEFMERYKSSQPPPVGATPLPNPKDPSKILAVGIERTTDFYQHLPAFEATLDVRGTVRYHGTRNVAKIGKLIGECRSPEDIARLTAFICESDFFEMPDEIPMSHSHDPTNVVFVVTTEGERWVLDRNETSTMHPTTRAIGEILEGIVLSTDLEADDTISLTAGLPVLAAAKDFPALSRKLERKEGIRLVCLGDDVTKVTQHTGGRRAYPYLVKLALERGFPGMEVTVVNAGRSGDTTADGLKRLEGDVLSKGPDLVTVMLGLNDMESLSQDAYRSNLTDIIRACRVSGVEVLLCTPTTIAETDGNRAALLKTYVDIVRDVAQAEGVTLADPYARLAAERDKSERAWMMLMSDAEHPNFGGHQLIAECIASAITKRKLRSGVYRGPEVALPHIRQRIATREPLQILAMPPYDRLFRELFKELAPNSRVQVRAWDIEGKTLAEIEESTKIARKKKHDLIVIAIPKLEEEFKLEEFWSHYTGILKQSLSVEEEEWDVLVLPPFVKNLKWPEDYGMQVQMAHKAIRAYDISYVWGAPGADTAKEQLRLWLARQIAPTESPSE